MIHRQLPSHAIPKILAWKEHPSWSYTSLMTACWESPPSIQTVFYSPQPTSVAPSKRERIRTNIKQVAASNGSVRIPCGETVNSRYCCICRPTHACRLFLQESNRKALAKISASAQRNERMSALPQAEKTVSPLNLHDWTLNRSTVSLQRILSGKMGCQRHQTWFRMNNKW